MNELTRFAWECLASGAVLTSLCAAMMIPPLAWLVIRALTPFITHMKQDYRWQAGLAVAGAVMPGSLFLGLATVGLSQGLHSPCLQLTAGRILYAGLLALIAATITRSVVLASRRHRHLSSVLADAKPVDGAAAAIAAEVGIPLFEIPDHRQIVIMVAATPRLGAYVSSAALQRLDDAALRASLFHERAHLERGDHRIAPWLYFLTDLLPLPVEKLIETYRCSREFCADSCALAHVPHTDLAAALLAVARWNAAAPVAAAAFAEDDAFCARLERLLRPQPSQPINAALRWFVAGALSLTLVTGVAAPAIASAANVHCQSARMSP